MYKTNCAVIVNWLNQLVEPARCMLQSEDLRKASAVNPTQQLLKLTNLCFKTHSKFQSYMFNVCLAFVLGLILHSSTGELI